MHCNLQDDTRLACVGGGSLSYLSPPPLQAKVSQPRMMIKYSVEKCDASSSWHWHTLHWCHSAAVALPIWPPVVSDMSINQKFHIHLYHWYVYVHSLYTYIHCTHTSSSTIICNASLGWHQPALWPQMVSLVYIISASPLSIVELHWPHEMPHKLRSTVMSPTSDLDWCYMSDHERTMCQPRSINNLSLPTPLGVTLFSP